MPGRSSTRSYLDQSNNRTLPSDYQGDLLVWDIDKTYLDTHFSSWRGLLRIPFELALDKESIPGSVPLLRALRRGAGKQSAIVPLYFVSGSPPQLRRVIERRMTLDGVDFDGISFKDQLGLLLAGRPKGITAQVGYKLSALLSYRKSAPDGARWLLFGDDVEADADAFGLFGEVCAGLRGKALEQRLAAHKVARDDMKQILALAETLPTGDDPIERIFIHLYTGSDPGRFSDPRVVATRSYAQTALVLHGLGRIAADGLGAVVDALRRRGMSEELLRQHLDDAVVRLGVPPAALELLEFH